MSPTLKHTPLTHHHPSACPSGSGLRPRVGSRVFAWPSHARPPSAGPDAQPLPSPHPISLSRKVDAIDVTDELLIAHAETFLRVDITILDHWGPAPAKSADIPRAVRLRPRGITRCHAPCLLPLSLAPHLAQAGSDAGVAVDAAQLQRRVASLVLEIDRCASADEEVDVADELLIAHAHACE